MTGGRWHTCFASPHCGRRVPYRSWCCQAHREILAIATGDFRLEAEVSSAWRERFARPEHYESAKRRALAALDALATRPAP